jgi:sphingomyelin phosphodiesterase acid-like 3
LLRLLGSLACILALWEAPAAAAQRGETWLLVSDIHLDPFDRSSRPSGPGFDTNVALFESAVAQMKRSAPDPDVILLPGDFLMHDFAQHVPRAEGTEEAALRTMRQIAETLGRAFPNAQFGIALGNNDTPCADYATGDGSAYQSALARIWAPLVDRRGASPQFAATFGRNGYYSAALPVPGLRLVVLDTVLFSSRYRGNCGRGDGAAVERQMAWFAGALARTRARNVVMMHIPPGYDAFSTEYVGGLVALPFLNAEENRRLIAALSTSRDRVVYAIAGHTHHFDLRIAGGVPVVVFGSLSPIFGGDPAFYVLRLFPDGSLHDIQTHSFDEARQSWLPARDFDRMWGVTRIDGTSAAALHVRLARDPQARETWDQVDGSRAGFAGISAAWQRRMWRVAWCAQDLRTPNFAQCANIEGRYRFLLFGVLIAVLLAAAAGATTLVIRSRTAAR